MKNYFYGVLTVLFLWIFLPQTTEILMDRYPPPNPSVTYDVGMILQYGTRPFDAFVGRCVNTPIVNGHGDTHSSSRVYFGCNRLEIFISDVIFPGQSMPVTIPGATTSEIVF